MVRATDFLGGWLLRPQMPTVRGTDE